MCCGCSRSLAVRHFCFAGVEGEGSVWSQEREKFLDPTGGTSADHVDKTNFESGAEKDLPGNGVTHHVGGRRGFHCIGNAGDEVGLLNFESGAGLVGLGVVAMEPEALGSCFDAFV